MTGASPSPYRPIANVYIRTAVNPKILDRVLKSDFERARTNTGNIQTAGQLCVNAGHSADETAALMSEAKKNQKQQ